MVSDIDTAKRAFVTLLKSIAVIYGLVAGLTRESTDIQVRAAYKKVSRKAHADKGGAEEQGRTWFWGLSCQVYPLPATIFLICSVQNSASPFRKFIGFLKLGFFPPSPLESCQNKF